MLEESIKDYLPKFLSISSTEELYSCLSDFPNNIDSRFYSDFVFKAKNTGIQGDGMEGFLFFNWQNNQIIKSNAMILSNSCDISFENKRTDTPFISYCPIISLAKYIDKLKSEGKNTSAIELSIKNQEITSMFYLPKGQGLDEDKIALLDKIQSCPNNEETRLKAKKIFTLSNYGFYLFLLKLSIHFTRIRDGIDRK
jgi:hypothetical protein